ARRPGGAASARAASGASGEVPAAAARRVGADSSERTARRAEDGAPQWAECFEGRFIMARRKKG
ncbi:hypothetical protein, partial [Burkholderia thailandensis]|uniref:hypothetical protein n=1 Tax=Burkholderia thailandensis TaxID=57975 RepID=UPI001E59087D